MLIVSGPEPVKASMVTREPIAETDYWFVYQNPRGKYSVVDTGNRLSQIEIKAENYKNRYTVRKVDIPFSYKEECPSQNLGRSFQVSIQLRVIALNPISIIKNEITNTEDMLRSDLNHWLSNLCSQYKIEELQELKAVCRNSEITIDLKREANSKGFSLSNIELNISLSDEDMHYYRIQEEIKLNEEIERVKFIEKKRTHELQLQAEEEERERQRQLQEIEHKNRLQAQQEEEEKKRRIKEEKLADNERLVRLHKKEGLDSLIFERDEEHAENVDILLSHAQKEKEHERQLELLRLEAEMKEKEKREEHNRKMEEKRIEMMQKLIETQLNSGNVDESMMRTIINAFDNSNNNSAILVENKTTKPELSWEEEQTDPLEELNKEDDSKLNLWGN